jgi:hypothetical protein
VFDTAFCGGDLTTMEDASATNELKLDEHLSRVEEPNIIEVTADSGEVSGLDKGHLEPKLDSPNADLRAGEGGDLAADEPGNAGGQLSGVAGEAMPAGRRDLSDRSDGSDGSVRSDAAAGVVSGSEDECFVGPALRSAEASGAGGSTAVSAIADDAGDLTAAHAETTNELNCDEIVSSTKDKAPICVTADSGEPSGLDNPQSKPNSDGALSSEAAPILDHVVGHPLLRRRR